MTKEEKYKYWLMLADYDIKTIDCLVESQRWVYVAFLAEQAMERQLKGMYVYYTDCESPKTHNVNFILSKIIASTRFQQHPDLLRFNERREEIEDLLIDLMFYYMSDYPFSYKNIMNRFVNADTAKDLFAKTKEAINWLRSFQEIVDIPEM